MDQRHRRSPTRGFLLVFGVSLFLGGFLARAMTAPAGQDKDLHVYYLYSPGPGLVRALVKADSAAIKPNKSAFVLRLPGGPAKDLEVDKNGKRGGVTTFVLLDESQSYRDKRLRAHRQAALAAIKTYAGTMEPRDRIGLIVIGTDISVDRYPLYGRAQDFLQVLEKDRPTQRATLLLPALNGALRRLEQEGSEPGLREVLVFTDAGDEVQFKSDEWKDLLDKADRLGVRVSAVVPPLNATRPTGSQNNVANQLTKLAALLSGRYISGDPGPDQLSKERDAARDWMVINARLCGLKKDADTAKAHVEYDNGAAYTSEHSFKPLWAPHSDDPCEAQAPSQAANAPGCVPTCAGWQRCASGQCEPKPCAANENCGGGAECASGLCQAETSLLKRGWPWLAAAGVGLLGLLLGVMASWLRRQQKQQQERRKDEEEAAARREAQRRREEEEAARREAQRRREEEEALLKKQAEQRDPAGGPTEQHERGGRPGEGKVPLPKTPLPEVHLRAIGGQVTVGQKWRLFKQEMYVGAVRVPNDKSPDDQNDLVFDVKTISSRHALFQLYQSGDLWITDLGASNSTFVNGEKLKPKERTKLRPGDQIMLSRSLILQVERPGFEPSAPGPTDAEQGEDQKQPAALRRGGSKKATQFDPGNR